MNKRLGIYLTFLILAVCFVQNIEWNEKNNKKEISQELQAFLGDDNKLSVIGYLQDHSKYSGYYLSNQFVLRYSDLALHFEKYMEVCLSIHQMQIPKGNGGYLTKANKENSIFFSYKSLEHPEKSIEEAMAYFVQEKDLRFIIIDNGVFPPQTIVSLLGDSFKSENYTIYKMKST